MKFYLGCPEPSWLRRSPVPLFVSRTRLARLRTHHPAACEWALDSGGFTELARFGGWRIGAERYAEEVRGFADAIGRPVFAAPQDRMCEPFVLDVVEQVTGRRPTVDEHLEATVENLLELRGLAPDLPWAPVVQGWTVDDYQRCADLYASAGVDLAAEPVVGVGSVCRRQATREAERIFAGLAGRGLTLHAFGAKLDGLARYGWALGSADSMAWSYRARRLANDARAAGRDPAPLTSRCRHRGPCSYCLDWSLEWRGGVALAAVGDQQTSLAI